jgi:hypothetical protein
VSRPMLGYFLVIESRHLGQWHAALQFSRKRSNSVDHPCIESCINRSFRVYSAEKDQKKLVSP